MTTMLMTGNHAVAWGARLARPKVALAGYPHHERIKLGEGEYEVIGVAAPALADPARGCKM